MEAHEPACGGTPGARPIESASASTACQTNGSAFAYIVTAAVMGVAALLAAAVALLFYTVIAADAPYAAQAGPQADSAQELPWDLYEQDARMRDSYGIGV